MESLHKLPVIACLALATSVSVAEEDHHQRGAHVHGMANLNLALQNGELVIEFTSPAANLTGFEHIPANESDEKLVHDVIHSLEDGKKLFQSSKDANCSLASVQVDSPFTEVHEEHQHQEKHGNHHEEKHDEHHGEKEAHSDFTATYLFQCSDTDKLKQIDVKLFEQFTSIEEIEVQYISDTGQGGAELTAENHILNL